ncbi:MAG TPA: transglycosylase domain-containing protein [Candidatus Dormibacteraeota bacterium]|nr:transglycosylase domain-containing protein [Candidatus Dormibacteraeota bacterium]
MKRRRVLRGGAKGFKGQLKLFSTSFTPTGFKRYWLNQAGARRAAKIAGVGSLFLFLIFLYFAKDLPSPGKINARIGAQNTRFYDRTGQTLIYEVHGDKNRTVIAFNEMPDNIKKATVAIEDKDFFKHGAFSIFGIGRAFTGVVFRDPSKGGGSTITQQYVKNALLSPERTLSRKVKELILAIEIEQLYKKDDILKLYLNEIPYGSQSYGIKAATNTYFSKDVEDRKVPKEPHELTLDEAALLAAMPQAPTYYSPYGNHRDALIARQHLVLSRMAEQGFITNEEAKAAKSVDTLSKLNPRPNIASKSKAPHFTQFLQERLANKYGTRVVEQGGLKVITSLDLEKQAAAIDAVQKNMGNVRRLGGSNSALVATDPKSGEILAMVGSYDYNDEKFGAFNVAAAHRQPGSSFKPLVYATMFKKNWGPGSTMYDVTTDFGGGYKPENYTDRTYGVQSVRASLAGSLNIPAVKALYLAGIKDSLTQARKMGISTLNSDSSKYGLSLVLGSGEVKLVDMANAYETFANGGKHYPSTGVVKITDARGRTLQESKKAQPKKALDPQIAYLISHILSDKAAGQYIFGGALQTPGLNTAIKTGTTENYRDAWTMGYTPSIVVGVWAGNNDNKSMTKAASAVSAPAFKSFITDKRVQIKNEQFEKPAGIKQVTLDANTGALPTSGGSPKTRTDIFPSWYKPETAGAVKTGKIDKVSGKLATDCTPPSAVQEVTSGQMDAEIPASDPAYSRWNGPVQALAKSMGFSAGGGLPTESDDVHKCSDTKPSVNLTVSGNGPLNIRADVSQGTHAVNNLTIYFDDQVISTTGGGSYEFTYNPPATGSHTIKAKVSDTALYEGTDEEAVNVTSTSGFEGTAPGNGVVFGPGSSINFRWTTAGGANKYIISVSGPGGNQSNNAGNSTSYTFPTPFIPPGNYTWYVQAYHGGTLLTQTVLRSFQIQ